MTGRPATMQASAQPLGRLIREIAGAPAVLAGNSTGGMISALQAAADPATVAGLVLADPSLPLPRQRPDPRVAGAFARHAAPGLGELYLTAATGARASRQLAPPNPGRRPRKDGG